MNATFVFYLGFFSTIFLVSAEYAFEKYTSGSINVKNDLTLTNNMKSLLQLNLTYNESQKAYDLLQGLKISYENYSKEVKNISDTDYALCISEFKTYNCSQKDFWREEILRLQAENDNLTNYLQNNLTYEKNWICKEFQNLRQKISDQEKNYNETFDTLLVHLMGLKKAMLILKTFYNLTNLSSLFERFHNNVKSHETTLIAKTAHEIKGIIDGIKQRTEEEQSMEKEYLGELIKKRAQKNGRRNLLEMKHAGNDDGIKIDVQVILQVYKIMNKILDSLQNSTSFLTNYQDSIEIYYNKELEHLKKFENKTEIKFNQTYDSIKENTSKIKDYEAKINVCLGKASFESDCDPIKIKAQELLHEVDEFLEILGEILKEFNQ